MRSTFKVYERLKREQHIKTLFLNGKAFSVFPVRFVYLLHSATGHQPSATLTAAAGDLLPAPECPPADASLPLPAATRARIVRCGFSVPKKKFRSSVHRHHIRRLMVEAWRLNKHTLLAALPPGPELHVFVIFTGREMPTYQQVLPSVKTGIDKLITIFVPRPVIAADPEGQV